MWIYLQPFITNLIFVDVGPKHFSCSISVPSDVGMRASWIVKAKALYTNLITLLVISLTTKELVLSVFLIPLSSSKNHYLTD